MREAHQACQVSLPPRVKRVGDLVEVKISYIGRTVNFRGMIGHISPSYYYIYNNTDEGYGHIMSDPESKGYKYTWRVDKENEERIKIIANTADDENRACFRAMEPIAEAQEFVPDPIPF